MLSQRVVTLNKDGSLNIDNYIYDQTCWIAPSVVYFAAVIIAGGTLPLWIYLASLVSDTPFARMAGLVVAFVIPIFLNEKYLMRGDKWRHHYLTNQNKSLKDRKALLLKDTLVMAILLAIFVLCWVFLRGK